MKYIIMFFCIIFCVIVDGALWLAEKMGELVKFGTEKVKELERSSFRGAHEKSRLLVADGKGCADGGPAGCPAPTGDFYDWAMEADYEA